MGKILEGVRVLDFGRYIAGPWCGALLADLGADVIRIEKRQGSEDRYVQPVAAPDEGGIFLQMNRNKRGMTLNPRHARGAEIMEPLVKSADIVIANMPPAGLKAAGLDYARLKQIRPDIILTTVSAYGAGVWGERVGFDTVAQTMSGAAYMSGEAGAPVKSYAPWVDFGTACMCAFATLAALMERRATGRGQQVEGALLGTALAFMGNHLTEESVAAGNRQPVGNRSPYAGPADIVPVRDGWIAVQVIGEGLFTRLAKLLGHEEWLTDSRLDDDVKRGQHGAELSTALSEWTRTHTQTEALDLLADAKVPAGPVLDLPQVLAHEHVRSGGFFKQLPLLHGSGTAAIADMPMRFSESDVGAKQRAPRLGEHTDEILQTLGFSDTAIASFRKDGVI